MFSGNQNMDYYFTLVKKLNVFFTFDNGPLEINLFIFAATETLLHL